MKPDDNNYIDWTGKIPKNWNISKIGGLYTFKNIKVNDEEYPPLSVTKNGILPQLENAAKSDAHDDRKLVEKGDFVINSRSDRRGSCGVSSLEGSVSLINIVLSPKIKLDSEYYNWLFHTELFADEFYKWGYGIVDDLWSTKWQNMKNIKIPVPPFDEQKKISEYLNKKCNTIDSSIHREIDFVNKLTEYKQSLVTEIVNKGLNNNCEMKKTDIDWIDSIPNHWKINKIKNICYVKGRIGWHGLTSNEYSDEGAYLVTGTDFKDKYVDWDNCNHISYERYNQDPYIQLKENDLLITKDGTIGKLALIKNIPDKATLNSGIFLVRPINDEYINEYLYWVLYSNIFVRFFDYIKSGSTISHLYQKTFGNFAFPYPPIAEQKEITNYLDKRCSLIDKAIYEKEKLINKLDEYKKSLIFEYVTGKKEVPK